MIRCAIYTRKSTDEGLEQDFNSLDAQREACEAYIASQKTEGWLALPSRYDDGGYSGGHTDRPAFQRLMEDIASGQIDAVVVYKIDRLSRSLTDFARIMEKLDACDVSLVSVTQQFNTTSSMGRLTLNMLLSFAQFEREIIAERTRDKIAAMRRKGKYFGGHQVLGYDVARDAGGSRLVINANEADQVRQLFEWYVEHGGLIPVVEQAAHLGWTNKQWATKAGKPRGAGPIDKQILWRILTNVTYIGKVAYRGEVYEGEHEAIVPCELWEQTQAILAANHRSGGRRNSGDDEHTPLLRGLLICASCRCSMIPTYTVKRNGKTSKRYRYYVCHQSKRRGHEACPRPSLPAGEIERFVLEEVKRIGHDPELRNHVITDAEVQLKATQTSFNKPGSLDRERASAALAEFERLWSAMSPVDRRELVNLLIERVVYDAPTDRVAITFRPTGIAALSEQAGLINEEAAT